MAAFTSLSRTLLYRSLLSSSSSSFRNPNPFLSSLHFSTTSPPPAGDDPVSDEPDSTPNPNPNPQFNRPLENGLDPGVYKAIMVGRAGQKPVQKTLRSGRTVVLFSLGTGGIRNNRRPLEDEEPREYADRCSVQWHRVSVYPERLADLALEHVKPGSILYLEGNLETKVFSDPVSGLVRRIREIALRRDGRLVFLSNDGDAAQLEPAELARAGYY